MNAQRVDAVRRRVAELALDAPVDTVLITSAENRRFVSGFTGSAGQVLIGPRDAVLLTDFRYVEQAQGQSPGFEVVKTEGYPWSVVAERAQQLGTRHLGFEAESLSVDEHLRLQEALHEKAPGVEAVPLRGFGDTLRQVKSEWEITTIRRAVELGDRALEDIGRQLRPGMSEREVAWRLEVHMREHGAEALSFPIIVAAGPHGAMPHHQPDGTEIQAGEPVVIDMGCRVDGYCSDLTRTLVLGEPGMQFWNVYRTVLRAQQVCEDGLKTGLTGKDGDKLARDVIEAAGHGDHFGHGTGHGVGLLIHEQPYLSKTRGDLPLLEGAVVTVEPGIYLPGWGGVRIEDMVVIGRDRSLVLTTAHKQPVVNLV